MVKSADPRDTSNKAAAGETSLRFPLNEDLPMTTRLKFTTYSRFDPSLIPMEIVSTLITLPIPLSIPDNTNIKQGNLDIGALGMLGNDELAGLKRSYDMWDSSIISEGIEFGHSVMKQSMEGMDKAFQVSGLKGLALAPIIGDANRERAQLFAGIVQNPHTNLIFEGVSLKSYNLVWRLSPRSQAESDQLQQIVDTIKMRIHPEEAFGGYALDYPDLVTVEFTGPAEKYLPKIHKSMVSNFMVSQGSGNGLNFYKSGAPIEYELTLSLTELSIITRETLREDGR